MIRIILLITLSATIALGQTDDPAQTAISTQSTFRSGLMTEVGLTVASTRMPNFRAFLRQNQVQPDFHIDPFIHVGVGIRQDRIKVLMQGEYGLSFNFLRSARNNKPEPTTRQQQAVTGTLMAGYDLVTTLNNRLYLNAGVGGLSYTYTVLRPSDQTISFQNIFQSPITGSIPLISIANTYWDINIEYAQREKQKHGVQNVIRLGYRRGIKAQEWRSDAFPITNAITDRISQVYIQTTYYFSSNR